MAGLLGSRAIVSVGPPLSWRGPILGSMTASDVPTWLPFTPSFRLLPVPSPMRLESAEVTVPETSGPEELPERPDAPGKDPAPPEPAPPAPAAPAVRVFWAINVLRRVRVPPVP